MPIQIGDVIEIPDEDNGWIRVRLIRRGTEVEQIERPSTVPGGDLIRIPVWIVEVTDGARKGESLAVPNGTIARISL
jgi:hypothetical protein